MKKQTGKYVDGFVLVVPKKKRAEYIKMATIGKKMWMKHGALDYKECVIDDPKPKMVVLTFNKLTKVKPTEEVWYSFITYKSRAHRDSVNKKVMAEMQKTKDKWKDMVMPFDMKRMAFAGFKAMVTV